MELTFAVQSAAFLYSLLPGVLIGVIYGLFKLLRTVFNFSNVMTFAADIAFMIISAVLIYLYILAFLSGYVRLYLLPGILAGFLAYRLTLGKLLCKVYRPFFALLKRVFSAASKKIKIFAKKVLKKLRSLLYNR
ncbi:MAG: spore cortex biosynthesis protein YabQ [Ruminococcus sp.]|nr:spore cortex biosynthesis protein YabQ [Ruminococcus sp.]